MSRMLIGTISSKTDVPIETIRYYERVGILPQPDRSEGGQRLYDSSQIRRISFVKRCRDLGFSLKEIGNLLALVDEGDQTCKEVYSVTTKHLENVRKKLADLKKLERVLKEMPGLCSRGSKPDCPIIEALFDQS
jgi:MerR family mercuric resistance operon transcriptional regulator